MAFDVLARVERELDRGGAGIVGRDGVRGRCGDDDRERADTGQVNRTIFRARLHVSALFVELL